MGSHGKTQKLTLEAGLFSTGFSALRVGDTLQAEELLRRAFEAGLSQDDRMALRDFLREQAGTASLPASVVSTGGFLLAEFASGETEKLEALRLVLKRAQAIRQKDIASLRQAEVMKRLVALHLPPGHSLRLAAERGWRQTIKALFDRDTEGHVYPQMMTMLTSPHTPRVDADFALLAAQVLEQYSPRHLQRMHRRILLAHKHEGQKPN